MRMKTIVSTVCILVVALCVNTATAWDVYKYSQDGSAVPDVNKPVFGDPNDNSCWMATASNMLGAAGYGIGGSSQLRADYIYNQLRVDLNYQWSGSVHHAVNYWLYTYGKNPDAIEFDPTNPYTDVTWSGYKTLTSTDHDFLLGELARCQYVGVGFTNPEHAMTLVGGDYFGSGGTQSVWHDSDRNITSPGDDTYTNSFASGWDLSDYVITGARDYTTLCPGLNKPEDAMVNFDVAWYRQTQSLTPGFRSAGENYGVYEAPTADFQDTTVDAYWLTPDQGDPFEVMLPNEEVVDMTKEVWLLVDYIDRVLGRVENVQLLASDGTVYSPTTVTESVDGGQLLFFWDLSDQPDWEQLIFPDADYYNLSTYVKDWDVATVCVPEPVTMGMLALGGLALLRRRSR